MRVKNHVREFRCTRYEIFEIALKEDEGGSEEHPRTRGASDTVRDG